MRPRWAASGWLAAAVLAIASAPATAGTPDAAGPAAPAADDDGPSYVITSFTPEYVQLHPQHLSLEELMQIEVTLGRAGDGFTSPRVGLELVTTTLGRLGREGGDVFYASAVQTVILRVLSYYTDRQYMGVYVAPDPRDITGAGEDRRPPDRTGLRLVITTGFVGELRTLASGDRIRAEDRVNNPLHERIRDRSPLQPYESGSNRPGDLLQRAVLDRYLFHLSRHPGRRVDAAVSAAGSTPGSVVLDYLVTENRPLVMYLQVSNTGTEATSEWQQRFGIMHTQLTNNDDVLSLDYITSSFDETNAFIGAYERPFAGNDRLRWRIFGDWSEYTARDVGFFGGDFTGTTWSVGGDLIANIHQNRELFIDLVAGIRVMEVDVENPDTPDGNQTFFLSHVDLRLDRTTEWFSTQGFVGLEWQAGLISIDEDQLARLGRTDPSDTWVVLAGGLSHSVYLEPFFNRTAWEDPATPESSTLAHELALTARGQYAFDHRLIPQMERTLGGLYTVRGYDQSEVAGDSMIVGSVEYRYHVPRALAVQPEPRELFGEPFRMSPQHVYGVPDWDLVLKAFLDAGRTFVSDSLSFESDETLIGAGIGVELLYRRNLNLRVDWGVVLEDVESTGTDAGSSQVHFVGTILF